MKTPLLLAALALLALAGLSCSNPQDRQPRVLVIGVDGLSPDGIQQAHTPTLDALMAGGAYSFHARAVLPSSSSPNWASMIMGAGPEQHGITSNDWEPDDYTIEPTASGTGPIFPTVFDLLQEQRPDAVGAAIYDWGGFGRLFNKSAVDVDIDADGPQDAAARAVAVLAEQQPALTFVHLDHVDHAGHEYGHGSPEYYAAVEEADRYIAEVVAGLEAAGVREQTTIIVTADHGGRGTGHGGETPAEMEIPWIINGPGIAAGTTLTVPINTYDTAATVAYVLGLQPPEAWIARPVWAAFKDAAPPPEPVGVGGVAHVVVIGVDGMSPDGVQKAHTPVMNRLIREGSYSLHARAVLTTSSSQNWASMIMGAGPEQHGITSNDWERDNFALPPTTTGPEDLFPSVFSVLRAADPDAYIAVVYDWDGFGRLFPHSVVDAAVDADGPQDAVGQARAQFEAHRPALTFIHLDHVDHAGHEYGHGTDPYYAAVEEADRLIGEVLDGLEAAGMAEQTLVLVTADHGGRGASHGGETMGELEIPWLAYGAGVEAGNRLTVPINTYDTAATVLFALGVRQPEAWIARPVRAAFTAYHEDDTPQAAYVPAPRIAPLGGFFVARQPTLTLTVDDPGAEIRYTLDGSDPVASSTLYEAPFTLNETAQARARAFRDGAGSDPSAMTYRIVPPGQAANVRYSYYEGDWEAVPDFDSLRPIRSGTIYEFHLEGVNRRRDDHYGLKLEGNVRIKQPGEYTFYLTSDDGSRLYVDGEELIDNDGDHGPLTEEGTTRLEAGVHRIRVAYFNAGGGGFLEVQYRGPGVEKQILSFNRFEAP